MSWENFYKCARRFRDRVIDLIFGFYKWLISPVFYFFGVRCRYEPTCSEYARLSLLRHGIFAGMLLAIRRLSRCHPWGGSGLDPVPNELKLKKFFPGHHKFGSSQR